MELSTEAFDALVEKAAKAEFDYVGYNYGFDPSDSTVWKELRPWARNRFLGRARAALGAVMDEVAAQAYDEGYAAAGSALHFRGNPYRVA